MPRTAYTPPLPGLTANDDLDTVINRGLGADSTAYLAKMLTDPAAHGIDLERVGATRVKKSRHDLAAPAWERCCAGGGPGRTTSRHGDRGLSPTLHTGTGCRKPHLSFIETSSCPLNQARRRVASPEVV